MLDPTQILEYFGLVINSYRLFFALPGDKATEIKHKCDVAIKRNYLIAENGVNNGEFYIGDPGDAISAAAFQKNAGFLY